MIDLLKKNIPGINEENIGEVSDGSHTFNELYDHRIMLYLSLIAQTKNNSSFEWWWSRRHSDGKICFDDPNWIVVGCQHAGKSITYHINSKYIPLLELMNINELDAGLEWDGHTSEDVLHRLCSWFITMQ